MNDAELLQAIDSIVSKRVESAVAPLLETVDNLGNEVARLCIVLEGKVIPRMDSLADGFVGLAERNPKIDRMDTRLENIETKVDVIKAVVTSHSEEINDLRIAK